MTRNAKKIDYRTAATALRTLISNPEDTRQVFIILRALSGDALEKGYRRFRQLPVGQRVLNEELDLIDSLSDRQALAQMPAGSLGRRYLDFMETEALSADGLVEASSNDENDPGDPGFARYAARTRDMHDLWHTLTEYGRDEFGEACLLAFTYAQTRNRGIAVIALVGSLKLRRSLGRGVLRAVFRAYLAGRRAEWLPGQDWETLLQKPIRQVRRELGIDEPIAYQSVRYALQTA